MHHAIALIPLVYLLLHRSIVLGIKPSALIIIYNPGLLVFLQHPINNSLAFLILAFIALIVVVNVFSLPFPFRIAVRLLHFFRLR
jgi:hypothetical protein